MSLARWRAYEGVILVGTSPIPSVVRELMDGPGNRGVIFYGDGVNNPWNGEEGHFYLLRDVEGRGSPPTSRCLSDSECAKILLAVRKVLTF